MQKVTEDAKQAILGHVDDIAEKAREASLRDVLAFLDEAKQRVMNARRYHLARGFIVNDRYGRWSREWDEIYGEQFKTVATLRILIEAVLVRGGSMDRHLSSFVGPAETSQAPTCNQGIGITEQVSRESLLSFLELYRGTGNADPDISRSIEDSLAQCEEVSASNRDGGCFHNYFGRVFRDKLAELTFARFAKTSNGKAPAGEAKPRQEQAAKGAAR